MNIKQQAETISKLSDVASKYPYYKYNGLWTRDVQNSVVTVLFYTWLGEQRLLTIEEVGETLHVPVNLKGEDAFHITIEEYLQSLITLIDELVSILEYH